MSGQADVDFINRALVCIDCGGRGRFVAAEPDEAVVCGGCGRKYSTAGGIIDFTRGGASTRLDDIDYDDVYGSQLEQGLGYYKALANRLSPVLDGPYRSVLEVGSGTGYLSTGLYSGIDCDEIVFSDISAKMLSQCKGKIEHVASEKGISRKASYVVMDGNEFCFADGRFDLVFGHGVLHHILNYEALLESVHRAMTADGVAVFIEPGHYFYRSLNMMLESFFDRLRYGENLLDEHDTDKLLQFFHFTNSNVKYKGVPEFVGAQEDKYQFVRSEMTEKIKAAGFSSVKVVPAYPNEFFYGKMRVHSDELKLSAAGKDRLLGFAAGFERRMLELLSPESRSSADVYMFEKERRILAGGYAPEDVPPAAKAHAAGEDAAFRMYVDRVEQLDGPGGRRLIISGWAIASREIDRVVANLSGQEYTGLMNGLRMDVFRKFRLDPAYATRDLIFSGFEISCPGCPAVPEDLRLKVVFTDGASFEPEEVRSNRDGLVSRVIDKVKGRMAR